MLWTFTICFQNHFVANTWGVCENGTEAVGIKKTQKFSILIFLKMLYYCINAKLTGCGPQETFKNCADIAILTNSGGQPPVAQVPPKNMVLVRDNKSGHLIPLVVR